MGRGVLALLLRSLRSDSRSLAVHLLWSLLATGIYVALCSVFWQRFAVGAPGLRFLQGIAYLDAAVLCLLGTSFFSSGIAEEREEGTLGLMRMAGINSLGILLGKSAGRLMHVLLLLAIQLPFWWLAITLGGVTTGQLWSLALGLASFAFGLANVGLLCSVLCSTTRTASLLAATLLLVHLTLGYLGQTFVGYGFATRVSLWHRIPIILETGFNESLWSWQVVTNFVAGLACFALAWQLLSTMPDEAVAGPRTSRLWSRWFFKPTGQRAGRRVWSLAMEWKDFYFSLGGWTALLVRCVLYLGLFMLAGLFNFRTLAGAGAAWRTTHASFQFSLVFALPIDAAWLAASSIRHELREQCLSTLMMLPRSLPRLVYSKLMGSLPGIVPGVTAFVLSGLTEPSAFFHSVDQFWVIVFWMVSVPHVAILLSLFLRWGAVPLAFGLTLGTLVGLEWLFQRVTPGFDLHTFGLYCVCPLFGLVSVACHIAVLNRLPRLAAR